MFLPILILLLLLLLLLFLLFKANNKTFELVETLWGFV
jgi:hypothetical protein